MSRENVEIIRDITAANNEGDFERALGHLADDVVLQAPAGIRGGTFRGREAVGEWFGDWFRIFDWNVHSDIREIAEIGDDGVLVVIVAQGRGRGSGVDVEETFAWLCRLQRGEGQAGGGILVAGRGPRSRRAVGVGDVGGERRVGPACV
jgi:ketosteroid isomerase-like protein